MGKNEKKPLLAVTFERFVIIDGGCAIEKTNEMVYPVFKFDVFFFIRNSAKLIENNYKVLDLKTSKIFEVMKTAFNKFGKYFYEKKLINSQNAHSKILTTEIESQKN